MEDSKSILGVMKGSDGPLSLDLLNVNGNRPLLAEEIDREERRKVPTDRKKTTERLKEDDNVQSLKVIKDALSIVVQEDPKRSR